MTCDGTDVAGVESPSVNAQVYTTTTTEISVLFVEDEEKKYLQYPVLIVVVLLMHQCAFEGLPSARSFPLTIRVRGVCVD
jgi:hypothetical protein